MHSSLENASFAEDGSLVITDSGPEAVCMACEDHDQWHRNFDRRCPLCWLEAEDARRDAELIRAFRDKQKGEATECHS